MVDHESIIDIDDTALDQEWLKQPKLMLKYGKKLAKARLAYEEAKANLEVVSADLSLNIRQSPADYNLEKVTEAVVESAIVLQKEHKAAVIRVNQSKYQVDMLQAVCTAIDHRKKALENRVSLLGMEWHSEPKENQFSAKAGERLRREGRTGLKIKKKRNTDDGR